MAFYDLSKEERVKFVEQMQSNIIADLQKGQSTHIYEYASDQDTYIRKNEYLILGRLYNQKGFKTKVFHAIKTLFSDESELVRQTAVNALGEIGKSNARQVMPFLEKALYDEHYKVRNAVIGSLKKMGEKNAIPVLHFAKKHLHHPDPKIRRQVIHGIELRGRTHPEDVLPLLKEVQDEQNRIIRKMIIHVLGQISYKQGCLPTVVRELKTWHNRSIVEDAIEEIIDVHKRYAEFSALSVQQAKEYINKTIHN